MDAESTEKRRAQPTINQDVPFQFDELFFSRTDKRGIILAGNSVFQRISLFDWDELIGKPHNIIRHPDMPRAVFWLLWETIGGGEPIGAYVKNRAKDGRYYWVFAIVTPIDGGYLSVRLKPSALLPLVAEEYKTLVAASAPTRMSPKDSGALLLKRLAELGFEDYAAFMAAALSNEMAARDKQLQREPDPMIASFDGLVTAAKTLLDHAGRIFDAYEKNQYVPLNLGIRATQLGESGSTIGVISANYEAISSEIQSGMGRFVASARQVLRTINAGQFLFCTARLQHEVVEVFRTEASSPDASHEQEMQLLEDQQKAYQDKALQGLRSIAQQTDQFREGCIEMKRLASSLEVTRVMGKMEGSRLATSRDSVGELINDLDAFQNVIADGLKEIESVNHVIEATMQRMLRQATAEAKL